MKKEPQKLNRIKIVFTIIVMILLIVLVTGSTKILKNPTNVFIVENGALSYEEMAEGYVIREEQVIKGNQYKNGMVQIISDNQKAAKGEAIFRYYSNGEEEIMNQISQLDEEINIALENSKAEIFSSDIISLEKQIENIIENMYDINEIQKINENKKKIDEYIYKKTQITGNLSEDEYIKSLTTKRDSLKTELENDSEIISAPISGIVSYRVDELEDVLKTDNFDYLSAELLKGLDLKIGATIPLSSEKGKIVDNFNCYIAVPISTEKAMEAKVGDNVTIRLSNSLETDSEVVYIKEEENQRVIVFKISKNVENLIEYRKISLDIIWWKFSGLKVSNTAIIEENEKCYIEKNKPGYTERILVKVLRQNDTYSIVTNYEEDELKQMGYSDEEISDMSKIKLYDEIILH